MLTKTGRDTAFQTLINNTSSTILTQGTALMNDSEKRLIAAKDWPWLWRQYSISSVASTVTVTIASSGVFTLTAHGFSIGTPLYFTTTGALPTGLSSGTTYYVIAAGLTANAFEVSTKLYGTAVNTTGSQSGTHTVYTQRYSIPPYTQKPQSIYVTVGGYRYSPQEVSTTSEWDDLNSVQVSSDVVTKYRVYDGSIELYPRPSSANVVTFNGRRVAKDLSIADYSTGTIDIVTNGSTLVTGSGTTWTSPMAGRWIRITQSNTASSSGDGYWYEIDAVPSATTLILRKSYGGTSLTTGAGGAYVIGEVSLIPEPHDQLPVFEAAKIYFSSINPQPDRAKMYAEMVTDMYAQMFKDFSSKLDVVLNDGDSNEDLNPNLTVAY